jgi:hypothetical protein
MVDYAMRGQRAGMGVGMGMGMGLGQGMGSSDDSGGGDRRGDFKVFLLMNPQLANGGLFLHYYSKQRMLLDAEARSSVLLPDIRPLPSLLSLGSGGDGGGKLVTSQAGIVGTTTGSGGGGWGAPVVRVEDRLKPRAPLTDEEFLLAVDSGSLSGWGHEVKLRLLYLMLLRERASWENGQRKGDGSDRVLSSIRTIEGEEGFHLTLNYFWLQMVTYQVAVMSKERDKEISKKKENDAKNEVVSFDSFFRRPLCQPLRNPLLYEKYYSKQVIDSESARTEFILPDLKQFPSKI